MFVCVSIYIVEKVDKFTNNMLFDLEGRCNAIVSGKMHLLVIVLLISNLAARIWCKVDDM